MRPDILIVGQGLAGTLLGWALERAEIPFAVADAGHEFAASRVAAGIINPITGRRLVKSWRIDDVLPVAHATYTAMETAWGVSVWKSMALRRIFADSRQRDVYAKKSAAGEFGSFVSDGDERGFWVNRAARIDVPWLLSAARARWQAAGKFRDLRVDPIAEMDRHHLVIDCRGRSPDAFGFIPWEFSKGQMLTLACEPKIDADIIVNRGHWLLPLSEGVAQVGATHEPGSVDTAPTDAGRAALEVSAKELLAGTFSVLRHEAGVRVNLPDRRPVAGRHFQRSRLGLINGLGAKGALLAPFLARQWVNHLVEGVPFDPEVDVARFQPAPMTAN